MQPFRLRRLEGVLTGFFQFYRGVLAWSTDLNLVALLDLYVAPTPVVTELVRGQLLRIDEVEGIREALRARINGEILTENRYFEWLSHSGLDFQDLTPELLSVFNRKVIHRALFDLQLGRAVKSEMVNGYSEVAEVRLAIEELICRNDEAVSAQELLGIWWDRAGLQESGHKSWVKEAVKREPRFATLAEMWVEDSHELQEWLDSFESMTAVVNSPGSLDCRTFSESTAVAIVCFTKVRRLNGLISMDRWLTPGFSFKRENWISVGGTVSKTCQPSSK